MPCTSQVQCFCSDNKTSLRAMRRLRKRSRSTLCSCMAKSSGVMFFSSCNMMANKLFRCTPMRSSCVILTLKPRIFGMLLDKPNPGTPTSTIRLMSAGCCAAKKPAINPPKEKPTVSTDFSLNKASKPCASGTDRSSASSAPLGSSESPRPGVSNAHTALDSLSGKTLRTQWFQLPLPPCNKTKGLPAASFHTCQTCMPDGVGSSMRLALSTAASISCFKLSMNRSVMVHGLLRHCMDCFGTACLAMTI